MANIRTLKALYQPISSAATRNVLANVAQEEKDLALQQANQKKLMKNIMSIGGRLGKDVKSYKLAKEGGYAPEAISGGLKEKFSSFMDWQNMPDIKRKKYHEAALEGQKFTGKETISSRLFSKGLTPDYDISEDEEYLDETYPQVEDTDFDKLYNTYVSYPREFLPKQEISEDEEYPSEAFDSGEELTFDRYEDVTAPATEKELYEADPSRMASEIKGQRYQEAVDKGLIDSPKSAMKWLEDYEQSEGDRDIFNIKRQEEQERGLRGIRAKNIKDEMIRNQQEKELTGVQVGESKFGEPIRESIEPKGIGVSDVPYSEIDRIGGETEEVHYDSPVSRKQIEAWDQEKKDAERIRFNKLLDKTGYSGLSLKFKSKDLKTSQKAINRENKINERIMNNQLNEEFNKTKFKMGEDIHKLIPESKWKNASSQEKYEMLRSLKSQRNVGISTMSNKGIAQRIGDIFNQYKSQSKDNVEY